MFKKLLVATAILATSSAVFAAGVPYVGANIGVNDTISNDNIAGFNISGRNPNFGIFGGYGATVNQNIYLGGEVFVSKTTGDIIDGGSSAEGDAYNLTNRYSYGVSFIPGVLLSEHTMLYGRAGLINSSYKESSDFGHNDTTTSTGLQAGLGLQTSLTQNIDIRGEYVYSNFEHFGNDVKPTTDQVNLGVVYKFQ
jgi:opacity protein-like surface antigen